MKLKLKVREDYDLQKLTTYGFKYINSICWEKRIYTDPVNISTDEVLHVALLVGNVDDRNGRSLSLYIDGTENTLEVDDLYDISIIYDLIVDGVLEKA